MTKKGSPMTYITQSLYDYLKDICRPVLLGETPTRELRIFLSAFPPEVIYELGQQLSEHLLKMPRKAELIYKVGAGLWHNWQETPDARTSTLPAIEASGWVDTEDKLTAYRNLKWNAAMGQDCLIIILIGVDQATDRGSLEDFFRIDSLALWHEQLKQGFLPWLKSLLTANQIEYESQYVNQMDDLLKKLYQHRAGDLLRISAFLESLNLSVLHDSRDVLEAMYSSLPFWELPIIRPALGRRQWLDYVNTAIEFFSYKKYLKEHERNKGLKAIHKFQDRVNSGAVEFDGGGVFENLEDFIFSLSAYIQENSLPEKQRLLKFDFRIIRDKILGYKEPSKPRQPSETVLKGHPLDVVLTAIGITLNAFKVNCIRKAITPENTLRKITLTGLKFTRDTGLKGDDDGLAVLRTCIGGLDTLLQAELTALEAKEGGETIPVAVHSNLLNTDMPDTTTSSSNAKFHFEVCLQAASEDDDEDNPVTVTKQFNWLIEDVHPWRTFRNMAQRVLEIRRALSESGMGSCLPIFYIKYYNELFFAPDENEINRIFNIGLKDLQVVNLLETEGLQMPGHIRLDVSGLWEHYADFLKIFIEDGGFCALRSHWPKILEQMVRIINKLLESGESGHSSDLAPMIYKAFLFTDEPVSENNQAFLWQPWLTSAVITPLHPALLEMLYHRNRFLLDGFLDIFTESLQGAAFNWSKEWDDVIDLAEINYPLFGVLYEGQNLQTDIRSFGLVHRIGKPAGHEKTLATKILQRYDAPEEEEFTDARLFRLNREARLLAHLLEEYVRIYPHASDGLSLAVLNVRNAQSLIAGVDEFLNRKLMQEGDVKLYPPYHFHLTVFTNVLESQEISRWLAEWQKRQHPAYGEKKYTYYQKSCLTITQKTVRDQTDYLNLVSKPSFEADMAILYRFIEAETLQNEIVETVANKPDWNIPLKFPVLEIPRCADNRQANRYRRSRVISNRRFRLATLHSEMSARFRYPDRDSGKQHIVISHGDFSPWVKVVDVLHQKAPWVLCLDPCVDERLIDKPEELQSGNTREIIGFSSGVGAQGELNYTISTEKTSLFHIKNLMQRRLRNTFGGKDDQWEEAANTLVRAARCISGLSLIKASTGIDYKVRDIIAFALVQHCLAPLETEHTVMCDVLVALDTFRHWFRSMEEDRRQYPDLMRIVAVLTPERTVKVSAWLLECKIASDITRHLEKAQAQLTNGLAHLQQRFCPRRENVSHRYDQRFWWSQLQRLIANKSTISNQQQADATAALEHLGDGNFEMRWGAAAITIWTEKAQDCFNEEEVWNMPCGINAPVITCGRDLLLHIGHAPRQLPLLFPIECDVADNTQGLRHPDLKSDPKSGSRQEDEHHVIDNDPEPSDLPDTPDEPSSQTDVIDPNPSGSPSVPERIFLGRSTSGLNVYWEFGHPELTNRHLLIFGKSGVGKTYAIQTLLYELGRSGQNALIIDYTEGFLPNHLEAAFKQSTQPETWLVRQSPLPVNPFRRQVKVIEGFEPLLDNAHTVGGRVTSVVNAVYSSLGEQQRAILTETIATGIDEEGASFDFQMLLERLKGEGGSGLTLANKLAPLVHENLFSTVMQGNWDALYSNTHNRVNVLQLAGIARDIGQMATEFILWDLYDYATSAGSKNKPLPLVLDEIQNLDHRLEAPLGKMLTEGRKFGLSLILATQTLSNLKQDEKDRLFQASHKLFFKPAETEVKEYARILEQSSGEKAETWITRLNKLNKGECYSLGPFLNSQTAVLDNRAIKIRIAPFTERH